MRFSTTFCMEQIEFFLQTFQKVLKKNSREYHYYFALAMALALHDFKDVVELKDIMITFIQHSPYQTKNRRKKNVKSKNQKRKTDYRKN